MIFEEQISRKPDYYPWTQEFIEVMQNGFWTHREFNFQSDIQVYRVNLTPQEREIIVRALSTIGQLEINVKKFWAKVGENLPHPTITDLGYVMANSEVIHGDAYERLLDVLGIEDSFDKILQEDIIRGRVTYLRKYLDVFSEEKRKQFVYSLILFTLFVENIALFSQFYTISYFGRFRNVLKDTNKQVEYTSREENLHAMIGMKLVNVIRDEHPELFDDELKNKIIEETLLAIEYECKIIDWIVNGYSVDHLNTPLLREFIKNRMNDSLVQIGFDKLFEVNEELIKKTTWFDEQVLGNNMTDFFHSRPIEYSKKSQSFSESDIF